MAPGLQAASIGWSGIAGVFSGRHMGAHSLTYRCNPLINDAVMDLRAFPALAQHTSLVQRAQMLRHVGLGGVNPAQQISHIFFAVTKAVEDSQSHRGRHHPE